MSELLALCPSNRRRVLVPLNKTNVYGRDERGLSSAHALQLLGPVVEKTTGCQWGCSGISCDSGTKLSLGPDSYFTDGLIYSEKPNTRIRATSATNATNCHTCQLDKLYVLVHCPIHCIASPPSEVPSGQVHQSQGFQNGNPLSHTPISIQ